MERGGEGGGGKEEEGAPDVPQVVELIYAVVDVLEVHVNVGPGEVRSARGRDVGGRGFLQGRGVRVSMAYRKYALDAALSRSSRGPPLRPDNAAPSRGPGPSRPTPR